MNDDLNIVISYVSKSKQLIKVALTIEHGLNNDVIPDWEYFREDDVAGKYLSILPLHVANNVDYIVSVEEIFWIGGY